MASTHRDYIPQNPLQFNAFVDNLTRYVAKNLAWGILDEPPKDLHDLNRQSVASRTPYTLSFTEAERGKTVYIALAWQNNRGNIGPWSEIQSAVIP